MSAFGDELKRRRQAAGLSLEGLAAQAHLSKNYIRRIEEDEGHSVSGKPPKPSTDVVDRLAGALVWSVSEARLLAGYAPDGMPGEVREARPVYSMIGARLRSARESLHYSQSDMANLLGISAMGYGYYESGRSAIPLENLLKLAKRLRRPVAWFVGEMSEHDAADEELLATFHEAPTSIQGATRQMLRAVVRDAEREQTTQDPKAA